MCNLIYFCHGWLVVILKRTGGWWWWWWWCVGGGVWVGVGWGWGVVGGGGGGGGGGGSIHPQVTKNTVFIFHFIIIVPHVEITWVNSPPLGQRPRYCRRTRLHDSGCQPDEPLASLVTTNRIINVYGFLVVIMVLVYSVLHYLYSVGNKITTTTMTADAPSLASLGHQQPWYWL